MNSTILSNMKHFGCGHPLTSILVFFTGGGGGGGKWGSNGSMLVGWLIDSSRHGWLIDS